MMKVNIYVYMYMYYNMVQNMLGPCHRLSINVRNTILYKQWNNMYTSIVVMTKYNLTYECYYSHMTSETSYYS